MSTRNEIGMFYPSHMSLVCVRTGILLLLLLLVFDTNTYARLTILLVVEGFEVLVSRMMNELKNTTETLSYAHGTRWSFVFEAWEGFFGNSIYFPIANTLCIVSPNRVAFWITWSMPTFLCLFSVGSCLKCGMALFEWFRITYRLVWKRPRNRCSKFLKP